MAGAGARRGPGEDSRPLTEQFSDGVSLHLRGEGGQIYRIGIEMARGVKSGNCYALAPFEIEGGRWFPPCSERAYDNRGAADCYHNWRLFVCAVLDAEGVDDSVTIPEIYRWHRKHGLESKLFYSPKDPTDDRFEWEESLPCRYSRKNR